MADYVLGRPDYPAALPARVRQALSLPLGARVVDLGCGTGLLARAFLADGHPVVGVEPDPAMAAAARDELGAHPDFTLVEGRAEQTGLPDGSADLAVAGQAFHWFEPAAARAELLRLLTGDAPVALVWNHRPETTQGFDQAYEALLQRHGTDYGVVADRDLLERRINAFAGEGIHRLALPHRQSLDAEGLRARVRSCSYVPGRGEPGHDAMMAEVDALFATHQQDGRVHLAYRTEVVIARLRA